MPKGAIVHPGYVDAHLHVNAQTCRGFFRGDASKGGGKGARTTRIGRLASPTKMSTPPRASPASKCLRHGITTFVEPGSAFDPDAVAARDANGRRPLFARRTLSLGHDRDHGCDSGACEQGAVRARAAGRDRCMKLLGSQLFRNRDKDGITHGHVALYGEGTASDELYIAAKKLADREGVILNNHVGFDLDLAAAMERAYGKPRFVHFAEIGVLGPNTTFVHMNLIRDEEVDPIVSPGLSIIWCPLAYVSRGTTIATAYPYPRNEDKAASTLRLGRIRPGKARPEMRGSWRCRLLAAPEIATVSEDVFEMMTLGGARRPVSEHLIGSLEARQACRHRDPWSTTSAELMPSIDPVHQLVTVGHGPSADTVLVNGRIVLGQGHPTRVDEGAVFAKARVSVFGIASRLGLPPPGRWAKGSA